MKTPVTPRGQRTRQKLLDAAEEIFGNKGYDNASVAEITQKAGVAQGTFYIYFPDKKAAFTELVRELNHLVRKETTLAIAGINNRMEAEQIGFQAFFKFVLKRPNLYRIIRQAEFVDYEVFRWHYQHFSDGYMRHLKSAMKKGQIKQLDAETLAYCLMAVSEFIGMRWGLWENKVPTKKAMDTLTALLSEGMANTQG
jgi:AcrR family transcriptional regulator